MGEKIPADCIILEENDISVNDAVLTGESRDIKKTSSKNLKDYSDKNMLFMGSFILKGKCTAQVIHTGMETKFGKIAGMISNAEKELPLQKKVNHIVKIMSIFGIIISILTGIIIILKTPGFNNEILVDALIIVVAMCVSSFPEGFPVVLITALASGSYRMAKQNAIVNRMSIIETLGETTVICSDKTGTITKGEMTVKKIFSDFKNFNVTGSGYEGHGELLLNGKKVNIENEESLKLLFKSAVLCNDSKIYRTGEDNLYTLHGTPTEGALLIMGVKSGIFREDFKANKEKEISFTSERKMMSIILSEKPKMIYSKGALEIILKKCKYIQRNNGVFRLLDNDRKKILRYNQELTSQSLRTLGFAYKEFKNNNDIEDDLIFLGLVGMEDPPREEIKEAIKICKEAGIKVKMITGDNKDTAISISKQINLGSGQILEGNDLDNMSDEELSKIVLNISIFARVRPEHKIRIVRALKENGEIVTMTGDGVNDAPALKEAHIGVAMGKSGTDVSRSVADLVLKDDNFATIVGAIKEGRTIFTNIQKFATYQISINFAQVTLIFLAILLGLPAPLIAIQILFMNLFTDEITAITLAFNPYSRDVMSSKPRRKSQIITRSSFFMLAISGLIMCLGSLGVFYYLISSGSPVQEARTVAYITMAFFGLTTAFNYRSFRKPTLTRSLFTNRPLAYASLFVIILILLGIYSPLSYLLETTKIEWKYWIIAALISLSVLIVFDLLKWINEKKNIFGSHIHEFDRSAKKK